MAEELISEAIRPDFSVPPLTASVPGEPLLSSVFTHRGKRIQLLALLDKTKETRPCRHGSGERYVRRHVYRVRATDQSIYRIYCERQGVGRRSRPGWWIYSRECTARSNIIQSAT